MMPQEQVQFAQRLSQKRKATAQDLDIYKPISRNRQIVEINGRAFRLEREDEHDHLDASEKLEAATENPFWNDTANAVDTASPPPATVDHRPDQTPIRDQKDRGTCVCFASLAALEAILKRKYSADYDLSEQYANWMYMREESKNQCDDGLRTTLSARYLSKNGVCSKVYWPYEDYALVNTHCTDGPSAAAAADAKYGIGSFVIVDRLGFFGPSIANPGYLEALLHEGYDIVFGTNVAWGPTPDANGIFDVLLDQYGNPLQSRGGHAMLIVGYDRSGATPYFIVKNSWGTTVGVAGYYYLSYDYVRTYAKYGYIIKDMREDMV